MSKDNGVDTITVSLDKLYVKKESASAFNAFENFSGFRRPSNMSIEDYMIDFNLRLCKIRSHAMDLPEGVLAYYLLSCANVSDEQTALCRATCMDLTYDDMKKQIERVSTNNESSTSTTTTHIEVKAEPQYLSQYDESEYYYEEDHDREVENVEAEDTYYNKPGTWPRTSGVTRFASKPMDSGCTKSVCGDVWLNIYLESLSQKDRKSVHTENSLCKFRFGVGKVYTSNRIVHIPVYIGSCCCYRPTPPACSCGGVRQPSFSREALPGVSST